jgi:outer membrane protein
MFLRFKGKSIKFVPTKAFGVCLRKLQFDKEPPCIVSILLALTFAQIHYMKNQFKYFITLALLVLHCTVFAQTKIGIVNYDQISMEMPETRTADSLLNAFFYDYSRLLQDREIELEQKYKQYCLDSAQLNSDEKINRQNKISDLEVNLELLKQKAQSDYEAEKEKLAKTIVAKLEAAIAAVSKEEAYTLILFKQQVAYHLSSDDISNKVRKKLGLKLK